MNKNKVNAKVKKTNRVLRFAKKVLMLGAGAAGAVFAQQAFVAGQIANDGYKSKSQIVEDAKSLNTSLKIAEYGPLPIKYTRLKHNGGEPIYYYIGAGFSEDEKQLIYQTMDYFNSVFAVVNENYVIKEAKQHEVIMHGIAGKTVFSIKRSSSSKFAGASINKHNLVNWNFIGSATILMDDVAGSVAESNDESVKQANQGFFLRLLKEEVLHMLGFRDVYFNSDNKNGIYIGLNNTTNILHTNTLMQGYQFIVARNAELSPSDYAVLNALYNENHLENGKVNDEKLNEIRKSIENYSKSYFEKRIPAIKDYILNDRRNNNAELGKIDEKSLNSINITYENVYDFVSSQSSAKNQYDHNITVSNNKLTYRLTDSKTKELVEEVSLDYYYIDGVIFVKDAFFKSGIVPGVSSRSGGDGGSFSDFALVNTNLGYMFVNMSSVNRKTVFTLNDYKDAINYFIAEKQNQNKAINNNLNNNIIKSQINNNYEFDLQLDNKKDKVR